MGPADLALAAAILAGAGWLLYRTLVKGGGSCGGCSQRGACHAPRQEIVRIGSRHGAPRR